MGRGRMGKGGKLSQEEKEEQAMAEAKKKKEVLEEHRKVLLDEVKGGIENEIADSQEELQNDMNNYGVSVKQLQESERKFRSYGRRMSLKKNNDFKQERWDLYLKCDKVPDVALVPEVHCFLYRWEIDENAPFPENCKWRIKSSIQLLEKLQQLIDEPLSDSPEYHANLIEAKERARGILREQIDRTTFYALKEMEANMERKGLNTLRIAMGNEYFSLCVWGILPYPKTWYPIPKKNRPELVCDYEEIKMNVTMPDTLWGVPHAVRLVQLNYDTVSDYCRVYLPLPLPENLTTGLKTVVIEDWAKRLGLEQIVAEEREARRKEITEIADLKLKPLKGALATAKNFREQLQVLAENIETLKTYKGAPIIPASQRQFDEEQTLEETLSYELIPELRQGELNLRQYMIVGGVYWVEAISQPPQPMELLSNYLMTTLELPRVMKKLPLPEEEKEEEIVYEEDAEALEAGSKAAFRSGSILTSVLDRQSAQRSVSKMASLSRSKSKVKSGSKVGDAPVIEESEGPPRIMEPPEVIVYFPTIKLSLPQNFLWYQQPLVVVWDEENVMWSKEKVQDLTFNEEEQTLVFNMNLFGTFALAVNRFSNLPYQNWEMAPGGNGTVTFSLTTALVTLKFEIKEEVITLTETSMKPNKLAELMGKGCSLYEMKKLLLRKGMNIFPEHDTHCYLDDYMPKHRATEEHLYHCMALVSMCYTFMWSPQNHDAGHRLIILQMQEYSSSKTTEPYNLLVSPGKSSLVKNVEVPQEGEQPPTASKSTEQPAATTKVSIK